MAQDTPILFIVSGPSGAGKGTFLAHVAQKFPDLKRVQTFTTRPPRPNESPDDYNFVTLQEFERLTHDGEIFEFTKTYDDFFYGSPTRLVRTSETEDLLVELEVKGMLRLKALSQRRVVSIFVLPPTMAALATRIKARHQEDNFEARLAKAKDQVSYAYAYDYVLVNDDLEKFRDQAEAIVRAERLKRNLFLDLKERMEFLLTT